MSHYDVDDIRATLKFGNCGPAGWWFTAEDQVSAFLDEPPYRALLETFARHHCVGLELPPYEEAEDCVEGVLPWASHDVRVYYETICSYLSFWAASAEPLESLRSALLSFIASTTTPSVSN